MQPAGFNVFWCWLLGKLRLEAWGIRLKPKLSLLAHQVISSASNPFCLFDFFFSFSTSKSHFKAHEKKSVSIHFFPTQYNYMIQERMEKIWIPPPTHTRWKENRHKAVMERAVFTILEKLTESWKIDSKSINRGHTLHADTHYMICSVLNCMSVLWALNIRSLGSFLFFFLRCAEHKLDFIWAYYHFLTHGSRLTAHNMACHSVNTNSFFNVLIFFQNIQFYRCLKYETAFFFMHSSPQSKSHKKAAMLSAACVNLLVIALWKVTKWGKKDVESTLGNNSL